MELFLDFCLGRADGVYVDGCTSDFTVCVAHTTLALHCTNSLKYDEISGMCLDEVAPFTGAFI